MVYRAVCKKCGRVERERESDTFLDPFFLPKRCPTCHDYKLQHAYSFEDSGWDIQYGEYVPCKEYKWWNPFTWRSEFKEIQ